MPFKRLALLVVTEGDRGQCGPIQRAVVVQDVVAERVDELAQPLGARFDHLSGDHVAVDDDAAELTERRGHRRLSGTDTAGQAYAQHRTSLSGRENNERPDSKESGRALCSKDQALPASFSRRAASWASLASEPPAEAGSSERDEPLDDR